MKKHTRAILSILLCCFTFCVNAQVKAIYFEGDDVISDSTKADGYAIYGKLSTENLWVLKRFDLNNNLLVTGTFKDSLLTVPHGRFHYYMPVEFFNLTNRENFPAEEKPFFLSAQGAFDDGQLTGRWIDFYPDGRLKSVITYVRGIKHGAMGTYSKKGETLISGSYANDLKEGEWTEKKGKKIIKTIYVHGEPLPQKNN